MRKRMLLLITGSLLIFLCVALIKQHADWKYVNLDGIGSLSIPASWESGKESGLYNFYDEYGNLVMMQITKDLQHEETYGIVNNEKILISNLSYVYSDAYGYYAVNYSNSATVGFCECFVNNKLEKLRYITLRKFDDGTERFDFIIVEQLIPVKKLQRITKSFEPVSKTSE